MGHDFKDFQSRGTGETIIDVYVRSDVGSYIYDEVNACFIEVSQGAGDWERQGSSYNIKTSDIDYECFMDTVNILIDPMKFSHGYSDTTIQALADLAVSQVRAQFFYTDDTKYVFPSDGAEAQLGDAVETSSFANSTVRYSGYKQVQPCKFKLDYRNSTSLKIRVLLKNNNKYDIFKVFSISYLTSGRIIDDTVGGSV
jgi:hypothetical protein